MAYEVQVARSVHIELDSAIGYIANELASPRAAIRLLDDCGAALNMLETLPTAYPVDHSASAAVGFEVRRIRVQNYRLYYRICEEAHVVQVFSFLHTLQNVPTHVQRDSDAND